MPTQPNKTILTQCPTCDALWFFEEIDYQHCDQCGYPMKKEEYDSEIDDETMD